MKKRITWFFLGTLFLSLLSAFTFASVTACIHETHFYYEESICGPSATSGPKRAEIGITVMYEIEEAGHCLSILKRTRDEQVMYEIEGAGHWFSEKSYKVKVYFDIVYLNESSINPPLISVTTPHVQVGDIQNSSKLVHGPDQTPIILTAGSHVEWEYRVTAIKTDRPMEGNLTVEVKMEFFDAILNTNRTIDWKNGAPDQRITITLMPLESHASESSPPFYLLVIAALIAAGTAVGVGLKKRH